MAITTILRLTVVQDLLGVEAPSVLRLTIAQDVASIMTPLPDGDYGDVTVSTSGTVMTINNGAVTNAKMADMAADTIKGRANGAGTGVPQDLTATQVRTILSVYTQAQVDAAIAAAVENLDWKDNVRVATAAAGTLASDFENGDTVDGVVIATGDRILIKDQASGLENGIYLVNASGAPTRTSDANTSAEIQDSVVKVEEGTANTGKVFRQTAINVNLGVTALVFAELAGGGGSPGGANTEVQFNDGGSFGGDAGFTYNKATNQGTIGQLVVGPGTAAAPALKSTLDASGFYMDSSGFRSNVSTFGLAHTVFDVGTGYRMGTGGKTTASAVFHIGAGLVNANYGQVLFDDSPGLTTPVVGQMEKLVNNWWVTKSVAMAEAMPSTIFTQTADKTVSNTVAETSIIGNGSSYKASGSALPAFPADYFVVGRTIDVDIRGVYTTPAAVTPTLLINIKLGSTVIATITTTSLVANVTNYWWKLQGKLVCRSTGGTGSVVFIGTISYADGATGGHREDPLDNAGAATTIDTTVSQQFDATVQWDAATATRSIKTVVCDLMNKI